MSIAKFGLSLLIVALLSVAASPRMAQAQSRTWHYQSNAYTQPASLPRYAPVAARPWFGQGLFANWAPTVPVTTPACNTCARSVAYAPQTPCATGCQTYQPVSACNTCVGSTTVLRPVSWRTYRPYWTYRPYSAYRPYWTYRPLTAWGHHGFGCSSCLSRTNACATPCGTVGCTSGACGAALTSYATPSCNTCAPTTTVPYYTPSQSPQSPPSLEPTPSNDAPQPSGKTFQETEKPAGDADWNGGTKANGSSDSNPRLLNPADRTTRRLRDPLVRPAVHVTVAPASQEQLDAAGWHPVSRAGSK